MAKQIYLVYNALTQVFVGFDRRESAEAFKKQIDEKVWCHAIVEMPIYENVAEAPDPYSDEAMEAARQRRYAWSEHYKGQRRSSIEKPEKPAGPRKNSPMFKIMEHAEVVNQMLEEGKG